MAEQLLSRKDTTANWILDNPVLGDGEIGIEKIDSTHVRLKVGNGSAPWSGLPYADAGGVGSGVGTLCPADPSWIIFPPGGTTVGGAADASGGFVYNGAAPTQVDAWNDAQNSPAYKVGIHTSGNVPTYDAANRMLVMPDLVYYASAQTIPLNPGRFTLATWFNPKVVPGAGHIGIINWGGQNLNCDYGAGTSLSVYSSSFLLNGTIPANAQNVAIAFLLDVNGTTANLYYSLAPYTVYNLLATAAGTWNDNTNPGGFGLHIGGDGNPTNYSRGTLAMGISGYWPRGLSGSINPGGAPTGDYLNLLNMLVLGKPQPPFIAAVEGDFASNQLVLGQLAKLTGGGSQGTYLPALTGADLMPPADLSTDATIQLSNAIAKYGHVLMPPSDPTFYNGRQGYAVRSTITGADWGHFRGMNSWLTAGDWGGSGFHGGSGPGNIYGVDPWLSPPIVFRLRGHFAQASNIAKVDGLRISGNIGTPNNKFIIGLMIENPDRYELTDISVQNCYQAYLIGDPQYGEIRDLHAINNLIGFQYDGSPNGGAVDITKIEHCITWNQSNNEGTPHNGIGHLFTGAGGAGQPYMFSGLWTKVAGSALAFLTQGGWSIFDGSSEYSFGGLDGEDALMPQYQYTQSQDSYHNAIPAWSSGITYAKGNIQLGSCDQCVYSANGEYYISLQNGNLNHPPDTLLNGAVVPLNPLWWMPLDLARWTLPVRVRAGMAYQQLGSSVNFLKWSAYDAFTCLYWQLEDGASTTLKNYQVGSNNMIYVVRARGPTAYVTFDGLLVTGYANPYIIENVLVRPTGFSTYHYNPTKAAITSDDVQQHTLSCFAAQEYARDWADYIPGQAVLISTPATNVAWQNTTFGPVSVTIVDNGAAITAEKINGNLMPLGTHYAGPIIVASGSTLTLTYTGGPPIMTYATQIGTLYSPINSQGTAMGANRFRPPMSAGGSGGKVVIDTAVDADMMIGANILDTEAGSPPWINNAAGNGASTVVTRVTFQNGASPLNDIAYSPYLAGGTTVTTFGDMAGNGNSSQTMQFASMSLKLASAIPPDQAVFTASMVNRGNIGILIVTAMTSGAIQPGMSLSGSGVPGGLVVGTYSTATGGVGEYTVAFQSNLPPPSFGSTTVTATGFSYFRVIPCMRSSGSPGMGNPIPGGYGYPIGCNPKTNKDAVVLSGGAAPPSTGPFLYTNGTYANYQGITQGGQELLTVAGGAGVYVAPITSGMNYRGVWAGGTTYAFNDAVARDTGGGIYKHFYSTTNGNVGNDPNSGGPWQVSGQYLFVSGNDFLASGAINNQGSGTATYVLGGVRMCSGVLISYTAASPPTVTRQPAIPSGVTLWQGKWMHVVIAWRGNTDGQFSFSPMQTTTQDVAVLCKQISYARAGKDQNMSVLNEALRRGLWY